MTLIVPRHPSPACAGSWVRPGLLACALAVTLALPLHAQKTDVVTLLNGDAVTGEVKELQRGLLRYYSRELIMSWRARLTWVEPDVRSFDGARMERP